MYTGYTLECCANRKSYMPRRLAQQRMTLNDLEWPFHASRAISAVAELLVNYSTSLDYVLMHGMNVHKSGDRDKIYRFNFQDRLTETFQKRIETERRSRLRLGLHS